MATELKVVPLAEDGSLPPTDAGTTLPLTGDYQQVEGFNANGIVTVDDQLLVSSRSALASSQRAPRWWRCWWSCCSLSER